MSTPSWQAELDQEFTVVNSHLAEAFIAHEVAVEKLALWKAKRVEILKRFKEKNAEEAAKEKAAKEAAAVATFEKKRNKEEPSNG